MPVGTPDGWRIEVAVTPSDVGLFRATVSFQTDVPGEPEVRLFVILWCDPAPGV